MCQSSNWSTDPVFLVKISADFFSFEKTEKLILKFMWKCKATYMETSQGNFEETEQI